MRAADVVDQLQRKLPLLTTVFSDEVAISSIVHAGTTATIVTSAPHGLVPGAQVTVFGSRTPVPVASITHAALASYAVVTTSEDHDLTLYRTFTAGNVVEVDGANEVEFEGVRTIVAVPNRRTIHIAVDPAAPAAATGTIRLLGASNFMRNVRGRYAVATVPSPTSITITHAAASDLGTLAGPAVLRTGARVTGALNLAAADRSYSEEASGGDAKPWLYVVLGESTPVREQGAPAEVYSAATQAGDYRQLILQRFTVLLALPSVDEERGRSARDLAADLLGPIARALLGHKFPTGFAISSPITGVVFEGEESQRTEPGPWYAHAFTFSQLARFSLADTVQNDEHVAFRDIEVEVGNSLGDSVVDVSVDLDEVLLP